ALQAPDVSEQNIFESRTAAQDPAEKKTVLIEPTVASQQAETVQTAAVEVTFELAGGVEQECGSELEADAALIAEQTIILSQARSQGFNTDISNTGIVNLDIVNPGIVNADAVPQVLSAAQGSLTKNATQDETRIYGNEAEYSYVPMEDYAQESAPLDAYQDAYVELSSTTDNDDVFNRGFDSQEVINSAAIQPAPMADVSAQIATPVLTSIPGQVQQQAAPVSLADDDILSAVLAARDSLLSDLDALSAKDGDEKKSSLDSKLKTSSTKPSGAALAKTAIHSDVNQPKMRLAADPKPDVDSAFDIDFNDDFDLGLETVAPHSPPVLMVTPSSGFISAETQDPAPYDRPPWEAAPDIELTESTQVDRAHTDVTRVESSNVDSDNSLKMNAPSVDRNRVIVRHAPAILDVASVPDTPAPSLSQRVSNRVVEDSVPISTQAITGHPLDLHWYKIMANLDIGGRVRQLAVNSICQQQGAILPLLLKPNQKHLAADVAIEQLEQALTAAIGNPRRVQVVIGVDSQRETPLELRKRFHKELLQQAHQSLIHDDNVQWLIQRMGAELDADSLVYPPERLNLRSQQIQALPELPELPEAAS
ncbi:MAG: DNA polymerase III subunit gamma/tau C-terminal domain-containing protein, partial [Shewanella sp.]